MGKYLLAHDIGTSGNKATLWYAAFVMFYILSMILLTKATKTIPIGTAYPVWTGIGAVGAVIIGIFIFKEPTSFLRLFFTFTLIASIIGLKWFIKISFLIQNLVDSFFFLNLRPENQYKKINRL